MVKITIWLLSFFVSLETVTWDDSLINGLDFMAEYVLQIPFFLMVLMRYMVPTLDNLYDSHLTTDRAKVLTVAGLCNPCTGLI